LFLKPFFERIFEKIHFVNQKRKLVIAVTGASGSCYALRLLEKLTEAHKNGIIEVAVVLSDTAKAVALHELGSNILLEQPFRYYDVNSYYAAFASGSSDFDTLIVCPCSMGTLARIAHGTADNLIVRTADVMLKERRRLILTVRETPFNLIHIENMKQVTLAGGIILPASPSFYGKPKTITEIIDTVVNRILELSDIKSNIVRWEPDNL
jgi:4-hydroxy-3-polyprenylbenzoate decarboxylase